MKLHVEPCTSHPLSLINPCCEYNTKTSHDWNDVMSSVSHELKSLAYINQLHCVRTNASATFKVVYRVENIYVVYHDSFRMFRVHFK